MRKTLVGLLMFFVFAITVPLAVDAQTCRTRKVRRSNYSRNYGRTNRYYNNARYARTNSYYNNRGYARTNSYYNSGYARRSYNNYGYTYTQRRPSFYRRHRNLINVGIGTGAGALIGALVGGRRGALIGTAIGAGGGALYTYRIRPKQRRYYRRY